MGGDRYLKGVLTVIAAALVYICVVLTPGPAVHAQRAGKAGEFAGPMPVVVVGWQAPLGERVPIVSAGVPIPVTVSGPVQVTGQVTTERSTGDADRVVLVGWEEASTPTNLRHWQRFRRFDPPSNAKVVGLPVSTLP